MEQIILACQWDTARYFIFSENVFANYIYYSHLFSAFIALLFGVFVFVQNKKSTLSRILLFITSSFAIWALLDLVLWATEKPDVIMFAWSILIYFDLFIYIGTLFLVQYFVNNKHFSFGTYLILALSFLPLLLLSHTQFNLTGFDLTNCDREALEGPLWHYAYLVEALITIWMIGIGIRGFRRSNVTSEKKQIALITLGSFLLLFAFSFGNILGTIELDWDISQFGLLGMPIFVGFLSYMIIRFNSFNLKVIGTQILVSALAILVSGILFIRDVENVRLITVITLLFILFLGDALIRSVKKEIKQRELLEELTQSLSVANEKLKGLDRLKTEFLSLASHQLRSPLTSIKGYSSLLLDGSFGTMDEKQKETVDRIFQSSNHLAKVVEDLLSVSKIEQGGMQYAMADFNLSKAVEDLVKDFSIPAKEKGITLTFTGIPDITMNGDEEKVRQVFLNIIDNSIKYTPEGKAVAITVSKEKKTARIEIKDTGMGIPKEIRETLFQKFSRGNGSRMNTGGSGLGLYLAKQIVEAHKGHIWVESEGEGKGSTFIVELPI